MTPIQMLIQKRDGLLQELQDLQKKYGADIYELNSAIQKLGGEHKSMQQIADEVETEFYDDLTPGSIKGTEDGI